ncbi:reverse transcriptase domain-containing protein [Tanacetum coccineum]
MEILIKTCLMPLALKTQNDSFAFVHELKKEIYADLKYVKSFEEEVDKLKSDKVEFSNMYDMLFKEVYNELLRSFAKLEKHSISLELALQQCQEQMKNDTVCKEKASNVFKKEREQYVKIQDLKAQPQDKNIAISELKKLIEKMKGKSVVTNFGKQSILGKPPLQPIRNQPVVRQPTAYKSERSQFPRHLFASQVGVSHDLTKPVTPHSWPQVRKSSFAKPYDVNAPDPSRKSPKHVSFQSTRESVGSNDMVNSRALSRTKDAQSHKTTKRYIPVEKKSESENHGRQIPIGQRSSPNKSSNVYLKTTPLRYGLTWKPMGRIFTHVSLNWIPIKKPVETSYNTNDSTSPLGKKTHNPNTTICANSSSLSAGMLHEFYVKCHVNAMRSIHAKSMRTFIMVSTMTTRNAGRRTTATQGGGTSEQDGREAERTQDQAGSGKNSQGSCRVPDFATIITQQLQNLLPTIVAQVGNHVNNQGNNENQDDNVINDNVQGNVRIINMNNSQGDCSYKEFMACNPKEYDGKGGVIAYTSWIEKMESVQDMSGCRENQKVKYFAGSFIGKALTLCNSQVQTRGREAAASMAWEDFKVLMREEFYPNNKMQKLETEFWCHVMVGAGHAAYTDRFHKLARLVPHLVTPENKRIERYI